MAEDHIIVDQSNDQEVWKDIPEHEGYQVSSLGGVRTCWARYRKVNKQRLDYWIMLKQRTTNYGYRVIHIGTKFYFVHRLVLQAFVGPRPKGADTRHLDDDKANNSLSNLKWGTRAENMADGFSNGKYPCGSRHYRAKLTENAVRKIREIYRRGGIRQSQIAKDFGVDPSMISEIVNYKKWRYCRE